MEGKTIFKRFSLMMKMMMMIMMMMMMMMMMIMLKFIDVICFFKRKIQTTIFERKDLRDLQ